MGFFFDIEWKKPLNRSNWLIDSVHHKDVAVYCSYVLSNWVSYRNIELNVALICSDNPFFKIHTFRAFTFKMVIDIFRLMSTMFDTLLNSFHLLFIFFISLQFQWYPTRCFLPRCQDPCISQSSPNFHMRNWARLFQSAF